MLARSPVEEQLRPMGVGVEGWRAGGVEERRGGWCGWGAQGRQVAVSGTGVGIAATSAATNGPPNASFGPIAGSRCSCRHRRIDELDDGRGSRNRRRNCAQRRPKREISPAPFGRRDPPPASRRWTSAPACAQWGVTLRRRRTENGMEVCFVWFCACEHAVYLRASPNRLRF